MNKVLFCVLSISPLLATSCTQETPVERGTQRASKSATPKASEENTVTGTVVETMNAANYTYVQIESGSERIWAAAPEFKVEIGDQVTIPEGMAMHNYHSKTLDRDFEVVYFVPTVYSSSGDSLSQAASPHGMHAALAGHARTGTSKPAEIEFSGIEKPEGGKTVGELFANKAELSGQEVTLRGKVVKFNSQIMEKNWLHVQDGSGDDAAGTHDVTITTDATAKVGDTVLVRGPVVLDKDFGAGYKYAVLIENATITVE